VGICPFRVRTITFAPAGTRLYRSMMSWLIIRMQPDEALLPIDCHSGVPWMR
jgi:hypothetical protein